MESSWIWIKEASKAIDESLAQYKTMSYEEKLRRIRDAPKMFL